MAEAVADAAEASAADSEIAALSAAAWAGAAKVVASVNSTAPVESNPRTLEARAVFVSSVAEMRSVSGNLSERSTPRALS